SGCTGAPMGVPYSQFLELADTNGDGLPDLVTWQAPSSGPSRGIHVQIRLNMSTSGRLAFSPTLNDAYDDLCPNCQVAMYSPGSSRTNGGFPGTLKSWDFDGDGRQDLVLMYIYASGS